MDLTAIYELPVPIWITKTALGNKYLSGAGKTLPFEVLMPQDHEPVGAAPTVKGVDLSEPNEGEKLVWVQEYGAFIPENLRPATALHRVVIRATDIPVDPQRNWRTADHQLADTIDWWFDDVRTWVEVLTWQDLDPRHRVYAAESFGTGLTFVEPADQGGLGMQITTPRISPLTSEQWEFVLAKVRDFEQPPLEEVLSRDARAAATRKQYRRAIIEAATALEIVLTRVLEGMRDKLPEKQSKGLDEDPTLGKLINIADHSKVQLKIPFDELRSLSRARNRAAHFGEDPGELETWSLLRVSFDFLGAYGPILRTDQSADDGSGLIIHE